MLEFERYITYDDVIYDSTDTNQMSSLQTIKNFMENNMICVEHRKNGNFRKYLASDLTSLPTHPVKTDFGYENLKTGSIIQNIKDGVIYMYDGFTDAWVEQP